VRFRRGKGEWVQCGVLGHGGCVAGGGCCAGGVDGLVVRSNVEP
jgi:hypothetical protein